MSTDSTNNNISREEFQSLVQKVDNLSEKLRQALEILTEFKNSREEVLIKSKETLNNLHSTFGKGTDMMKKMMEQFIGVNNGSQQMLQDETELIEEFPQLEYEELSKMNPFE